MALNSRNKTAKKIRDYVIHYVIILLVTLFVMFPYYWMLITSLKPPEQLMLSPPVWFPSYLDFSNYINVWSTIPLLKYMRNSLFVAVCTTALCLVLSTPAAYSLARYKTRIRNMSIKLFLFSQLIPGIVPFIAFYFLMFNLRLTNTYAGLIIAYAIWGIPFCTLMMRGYFASAIPQSLEESAIIDGCTRWGAFVRVAIPLAIPGLVATAIYSFILAWNEFMWASVMLNNNEMKPVSVGIYDYIGQYGGNVKISMTMATAVLITLPVMIIFSFLQKHLISGLTAGAIKG